jgi:hypothetical protein
MESVGRKGANRVSRFIATALSQSPGIWRFDQNPHGTRLHTTHTFLCRVGIWGCRPACFSFHARQSKLKFVFQRTEFTSRIDREKAGTSFCTPPTSHRSHFILFSAVDSDVGGIIKIITMTKSKASRDSGTSLHSQQYKNRHINMNYSFSPSLWNGRTSKTTHNIWFLHVVSKKFTQKPYTRNV